MKYNNINEYWEDFNELTKKYLVQIHAVIQETAPEAIPIMAYNMPAFKYGKIIAYYAGYKNHIGFYPMPACIQHFAHELKPYKTSKGTVQFALDKPLPIGLIQKMILFNLKVNS